MAAIHAPQSSSGISVSCEFESQPEPDLLWVNAKRYLTQHPSPQDVKLAIEVSDSSLQTDLIEKAQLYAQARIIEYWIVDIQAKCVHAFRAPQNGSYSDRSVVKAGEYLKPLQPCTTPLNLADLFRS
jgi:Uma2 family endonuclease